VGSKVYIQAEDGHPTGYAVIRHCAERGTGFLVGLELNEETRHTVSNSTDPTDYYEFLQISPNAEPATIHRIYRFLAARYHPDNPETADPQKFIWLNQAFAVLSNPVRRAEYDAALHARQTGPVPGFDSVDFMDGIEGEVNRRLAVLSLLYRRCRASVSNRMVTLAELEMLMGFPREYLDFTTWYLKTKKYITREDNSDFALTVLGVDYVESNYSKLPLLRKMLNAANSGATGGSANGGETARRPDGAFVLGASDSDAEEPDEIE
jgi:curved DNA-binding protein CbpA